MTGSSVLVRLASKVAAVGLLIVLVWFVAAVAVNPLMDRLSDAQDGIAQERVLLGHLLQAVRAITKNTGQPAPRVETANFLAGETDAEKIAGLQAHIEALAAKSGVRLTSLQPAGERAAPPLRVIGLRTQVGGSIAALQSFLYGLENGRPAVVVEAFDIVPSSLPRDAPGGDLEMRLSVAGVVQIREVRP